MLCALEANDPEEARDIYDSMPAEIKDEPATRYLLFKSAALAGDCGAATECLRVMMKGSADASHVLACVHTAQQAQSRLITLEATQALLECHDRGRIDGSQVSLPTLLRCSIRLLQGLAKEPIFTESPESYAERMCGLFEAGQLHGRHRTA